MYRIKYEENGEPKETLCKVEDLGSVMSDLQARGITKYLVGTAGVGAEKRDGGSDSAEVSNVFGR